MPATDLDQIVNLCKRRGFVYPSAEIYGGFLRVVCTTLAKLTNMPCAVSGRR